VFGGTAFDDDEILSGVAGVLSEHDWTVERVEDVGAAAAKLVAMGAVIGWFQGRSEFGARALGARSIIADPRDASLKTSLNRMKGRELFRPFAPSVLRDQASAFFVTPSSLLFDQMLGVTMVRPEVVDRIPAVVHIDQTARIQLVHKDRQPLFYGMISQFRLLTGIPMVLNTSFNFAGEPIVETPADAARSALVIGLHALVAGSFVCRGPQASLPRLR
jgi:carbamoyltransferase